jgi:hypothetical protein
MSKVSALGVEVSTLGGKCPRAVTGTKVIVSDNLFLGTKFQGYIRGIY